MLGFADYALTTALPIEEVRHRIGRHLIEWQLGDAPDREGPCGRRRSCFLPARCTLTRFG
jgi:hypothetical protein